jgi:hypothetical protein
MFKSKVIYLWDFRRKNELITFLKAFRTFLGELHSGLIGWFKFIFIRREITDQYGNN